MLNVARTAVANGITLKRHGAGWLASSEGHNTYSGTPEAALAVEVRRIRGKAVMGIKRVAPSTLAEALLAQAAPHPVATADAERPPLVVSGDEPLAKGTPAASTKRRKRKA